MAMVQATRGAWCGVGLAFAVAVASCGGTKGGGGGMTSDAAPGTEGGAQSDASKDARASDAKVTGKDGSVFVSHDAGSDCGGRTGNPCGDGASCTVASDCQSELCTKGICTAPPATCSDGKKDGSETDVDCGGADCPACGTSKDCAKPTDCTSLVCIGGTCQAVSDTDGVKNDSETDVDCGGALQADGR